MLRLAKLLLILLTCQLTGCGEPESLSPETPERKNPGPEESVDQGPRVLFLGDSITAGLHLEAGLEDAFPAVAARMAQEQAQPFVAINAGVSGDTSAGGLRRLAWVSKNDPDIIVIELGGNDGLRGQPIDEIKKNLGSIIDRSLERGFEVLLLGMLIPPSYGDYARDFEALYVELAESREIHFLPAFMADVGGRPELNFRDRLHPNQLGHQRLAEKLLPALLSLIESMKSQAIDAKTKG